MPHRLPRAKKMASVLAGTAAAVLSLCLSAGSETACAAPGFAAGLGSHASLMEPVRIYRRGRTPIYPYFYNPGRRGGYSFYFGFVPYAKGDIENQALQRNQYPQDIEWPPSMRPYGPQPGFSW
jgi:hypothetical protein